jgi:MFS family permease
VNPALLSPAYRRRFLAVLCFVCLFNLGDRAVFSVVVPAMRVELGLTDFQIGILEGFSFALLYGGLGIPVGRLAERFSRVRLIALATGIWSVATALSGVATGFLPMMATRVAVGMGEAGFTAPTASLVADHFEPRRRASAMSLIMLGLPFGTLAGAIGGGYVAQHYGWRMAFLALGLPGVFVALAVRLLLREPRRGLADGQAPATVIPPFGAVIRHILGSRSLRHVMLGGGISAIGIQGVAKFMPLLFTRAFHLPIGKAAALFGVVSGTSLAIGLLLGALGTDRASRRDERWPAWGPALAFLVAPVCYVAGFGQSGLPATAALLMGGGVLAMVYYGPSIGMLQNLTPQSMRASTSAVFAMLMALVGTGVGPTLVGYASDRFAGLAFAGDYTAQCTPGRAAASEAVAIACGDAALNGLRRALTLCVLSFAWAALHYLLASRGLREELRAARAATAVAGARGAA